MDTANNVKNIQEMRLYRYDELSPEMKEKADRILQNAKPGFTDTFTRSDLSQVTYENYVDCRIVTGMPKSVFGDQFGYDMQDEIGDCMADFYAGKISQDDVRAFFEKCCSSMRSYRTQRNQTTGMNPEANRQIVGEVYEVFAKENQRAARHANYQEGEALNSKYGGKRLDWVYYNSDYYYKCVDGNNMLRGILSDFAEQWELPALDPDEIEANSRLTLDGGFDFNSGWNFEFRNQAGIASMADESVEPPRDFKLFYKENFSMDMVYSSEKGYLSVTMNGREYVREIPFYISKGGSLKGQIYSLQDLLTESLKESGNGQDYSHFLSNIALFTMMYSTCSGINNMCGNYIPRWE